MATLFTTLTAICADFAAVGHNGTAYWAHHPEESLSSVILQSIAEALTPAILEFTVLSSSALVVALGC
ncbi:MAG TPA: hypothetical protein VGM44_13515, partial [Polyangiaceae bacterium]